MFLQESLESDPLPTPPPSLELCPANDDSFPTPFPVVKNDDSLDFVTRAFNEARMAAEKALGNNAKTSKKTKNASNVKINREIKKDTQKKVNKETTKEKESCWWFYFKFTSCPLQKFYDEDMKGNKTMSKKNFASRIYHREDKYGSRADARAAHKAALEFFSLKLHVFVVCFQLTHPKFVK